MGYSGSKKSFFFFSLLKSNFSIQFLLGILADWVLGRQSTLIRVDWTPKICYFILHENRIGSRWMKITINKIEVRTMLKTQFNRVHLVRCSFYTHTHTCAQSHNCPIYIKFCRMKFRSRKWMRLTKYAFKRNGRWMRCGAMADGTCRIYTKPALKIP